MREDDKFMETEKRKANRYIVLIAGMLIQFCAGIIYMWSVFKAPVTAHLSWDGSSASLTSSIMLAMFVAGIIIGGRAQDVMGPRKITVIGSILISLGMILTSFVTKDAPWVIYITYGVVGGFGVGAVYTSTVATIQKWFPDRRGFATGMTVGAFGFSLVVFAPLANMMLARIGVPHTFLIFGIAFLVVCLLSSIKIVAPATLPTKDTTAAAPVKKQYTLSEALKTGQLYLILFWLFFILPAYFILNPIFLTLGAQRGLSEAMAVAGVMITGAASAAGRLILTWMSDKTGRKPALALISIITLVSILVMIFAKGALFLVCIALIAFAFGGAAGVSSATTADTFGTKNVGVIYGFVMLGFGGSALLFPALSNVLSKSGSYTSSFIAAAATCVVALVLVIFIKKPADIKQN